MNFLQLLEKLTGQPAPFQDSLEETTHLLKDGDGVGLSQLNECLLLSGYDRISASFFQYLVDGSADYMPGTAITSLKEFTAGVDRFRKHALLRFGNIKYAFKYMSSLPQDRLELELSVLYPVDPAAYSCRHCPVRPVTPIRGEETYYLGYLIERDLNERLLKNPDDEEAKDGLRKRKALVEQGERNQEAYLCSDHMDVYVATSMRERHEYYLVNHFVSRILDCERLLPLKLRWFDPTQAFCHDRIDKGLSEALMLKRARCTLYFAQESDTLGKDSELASTLAQGKPVVAFVPRLNRGEEDQYVAWLLDVAKKLYPERTIPNLIVQQLQVFAPVQICQDQELLQWVQNPDSMPLDVAQRRLVEIIRQHYDKRAQTLIESHPLGIQVHLETGVANGVLVARETAECAELIYRIMTNTLEFDLEEKQIRSLRYLLLRERISGCVFRVVTGDQLLTNSFWNFYLK